MNDKVNTIKSNVISALKKAEINVPYVFGYEEDGIITIGVEVDETDADRTNEVVGGFGHSEIVVREPDYARIYLHI